MTGLGAGEAWSGGSRGGSFQRRFSTREEDFDDEENLIRAALERLPTYDRLRTTIHKSLSKSRRVSYVDLSNTTVQECRARVNTIIGANPAEDNEKLLLKLRERLDKVGVRPQRVEVRYENLNLKAKCHIGSRALPSIWNSTLNSIDNLLELLMLIKSRKKTLPILRDASGIIKPGRMTILLGPPSSGKSSLLLALANKLDAELKLKGTVTYNGFTHSEFLPQKTSVYVSQNDLHLGEMTVRETMKFSAECQGVGSRLDMMKEVDKREKELGIVPDPDVDFILKGSITENMSADLVTEFVLKILGLDICSDIIVGDNMRRGISGGQRKRVTTAEMIVGPTKTFFMDEISTGLDSSTTFQIIKCFSDFVHNLDFTMLITLLQPAPETFNLFDDVILITEGQVVYHGPRENIAEFFESCGFKCPERKGLADFLQEVTSIKDQEQYWFHSEPHQYVSARKFAELYKKFHVGSKMFEELATPVEKTDQNKAALSFDRYSVTKWDLFKISFNREWLLTKRNAAVNIFMSVRIAVIALLTMGVFFRKYMHRNTLEDATIYSGALFFGTSMVMFNGFSELAQTMVRLPVIYKQRDMYLYPAWAYALPTIALKLPVSIIESVTWIAITYYTIGFAPAASRFFKQILLYFWVNQTASAMFRLVAGVCRTPMIANTGGNVLILAVFVLGGFLVRRPSIRPWWIWGYYLSPLSYAQNGVAVTEFLAPQWNRPGAGGDPHTLGRQYLIAAGVFRHGWWYWISLGVMIMSTFWFNFLFVFALAFLNPLDKTQAVISEDTLQERLLNWSGEGSVSVKKSLPRSLSASSSQSTEQKDRESGDFAARPSTSTLSRRLSSLGGSMRGGNLSRRISIGAASGRGDGAPNRGMILPFQPLSISFKDVAYFVDMPSEMRREGAMEDKLQLLRGVTGAFRPGVLTALVGVSGAGKTTLMDVLAGRKSGGIVEGDIRISGFPKKQETFTRISGYCEQNDIHSPQLTVRESLIFSAWLRLPHEIDDETRELFVDEVMELGELTGLRDALVGMPGVTGLSTEQRKRLTIAVELVANPSIIFMDEPTSGLDARAAAIVMRAVRNTVDTGRTVVCTIHQPSIDIFEAFDELLLLKRGGRVIYAGPLGRNSHHLVEYFEAVPGIPKLGEGYNPATWMLEISSTGVEQRLGVDFADIYDESSLKERNKTLVASLAVPTEGATDLEFPTKYSQPLYVQFRACLWKQHVSYWRTPDYNFVRLWFTALAALFFGTVFWNVGQHRHQTSGITQVMGGMYAAVMFLGFSNATNVQPVVSTERAVLYREGGAGMYSPLPYAIAQVLIEIPYCMVQTVIYAVLTYATMNLEWTAAKFFWYLFLLFFSFLTFTYYGMMWVAITPSLVLAVITSGFFYNIFNIFSGFLIPRPRIPMWCRWYYWAVPNAWTLYGIIVSQFGDLTGPDHLVLTGEGQRSPIADWVRDYYGFHHDFLGVVAAMTIVMPLLFGSLYVFGITFLNFQHR